MAENKYVIFKLEDEEFGVDIMQVKEVSDLKGINRVPDAPNFIEGIVNLRGDITPIVNLKKRFSIQDSKKENPRIIVTSISGSLVGFIVDDASQVLTLEDDKIEIPPSIIAGGERKYIKGVGKLKDYIVLILDLEKILSEEETKMLESIK